ncbi:MAG: hypothetical protein ACH37Z_14960 [Anaerolineae bacterium]
MANLTPGPWAIGSGNAGIVINGADGRSVASIGSQSKRPLAEKEANAKLIAAAPFLLNIARELSESKIYGPDAVVRLAERAKNLLASLSVEVSGVI